MSACVLQNFPSSPNLTFPPFFGSTIRSCLQFSSWRQTQRPSGYHTGDYLARIASWTLHFAILATVFRESDLHRIQSHASPALAVPWQLPSLSALHHDLMIRKRDPCYGLASQINSLGIISARNRWKEDRLHRFQNKIKTHKRLKDRCLNRTKLNMSNISAKAAISSYKQIYNATTNGDMNKIWLLVFWLQQEFVVECLSL